MLEAARYRRHFKVHGDAHPAVDALAIAQGWWTPASPRRTAALTRVAVDSLLGEDEWVLAVDVHERVGQDVDATLRALEADGVLRLLDGGARVSTPAICGCSAAVKRLVAAYARDDGAAPWGGAAPDPRLSDRQLDVVQALSSGRRLVLCCAAAGTGKTFTAAASAAECPDPVLCLAPTWKAISVLRGKIVAPQTTFLTVQGFVVLPEAPVAGLVVVDESSMLTMGHFRAILDAYVDSPSTRLLFLGDDAQLPCIGRGFPLRDVLSQIPPVVFTACVRTDRAGLLDATGRVRAGAPLEANDDVSLLEANDPLTALRERTALLPPARAGGDAASVPLPWDPEYVQFITPQNNHVALLNEEIQ